jgi:colanic acid/amylovoran biosynthesis glycosyltransferase
MRIAVFSNRFPILSETFVINQVIGLIENKVEIDIYANTGSSGVRVHQSVFDYGLMEKVKYFGFKSTIKNNFKFKKIFSYIKNILN